MHECQICKKEFSRKQSMEEHMVTIHSGEKPYQCKYCSKTFKSRGMRGRHVKKEHIALQMKLKSDCSPISIEFRSNLIEHRNVAHNQPLRKRALHNSSICSMDFKEHKSLEDPQKSHFAKQHSDPALNSQKLRDQNQIENKENCFDFPVELEIQSFDLQNTYPKTHLKDAAVKRKRTLHAHRHLTSSQPHIVSAKNTKEISNDELQKMIVIKIRTKYATLFR